MRIVISWSGATSHKVALALKAWLNDVIQAVDPWVSSEDIQKGTNWPVELAEVLKSAKFGISCLTRDNLTKPWLLFEAGAISNALKSTRLCTYLVGLENGDVEPPLGHFQGTKANKRN
jgi:hypothetical protein